MARCTWQDLPAAVRAAIEHKAGPVTSATIPTAGRNSDFSATLRTDEGLIFCKGITDAAGHRGAMHRHEADINPWLPPSVAPRLRWRIDTDGWLLLGFDHVPGRHADLTPGSPDLPLVARAVATLTDGLAHCPADAPRLAGQWRRLAAWRRLAKDTPNHPADRRRPQPGRGLTVGEHPPGVATDAGRDTDRVRRSDPGNLGVPATPQSAAPPRTAHGGRPAMDTAPAGHDTALSRNHRQNGHRQAATGDPGR